jgi:hypothetical protein
MADDLLPWEREWDNEAVAPAAPAPRAPRSALPAEPFFERDFSRPPPAAPERPAAQPAAPAPWERDWTPEQTWFTGMPGAMRGGMPDGARGSTSADVNPGNVAAWRAVQRGGLRTAATVPFLNSAVLATAIQDAGRSNEDIIRRAFLNTLGMDELPEGVTITSIEDAQQALADLGYTNRAVEIRDAIEMRLGYAQQAREDTEGFLGQYDQALGRASSLIDRAADIPMSPGAERMRSLLQEDTTVGGTISAMVSNPGEALLFLGEIGLESAPQIAASAATTAITRSPTLGALAMGAGTVTQEGAASGFEFLQENGITIESPEDVRALLENGDLLQQAASRGVTRAVVIAAFEMAGQGAAARRLFDSPIGEGLAQSLVQAATGAGGEAAAQVAAGQGLNGQEILLEGLAELVTAVPEVAAARVSGISGNATARETDIEPGGEDEPDAPTIAPEGDIDPDQAAALGPPAPTAASVASGIAGQWATAPSAETAPEVTPEVTPDPGAAAVAADVEAAARTAATEGDTIPTVPESRATIDQQLQDLVNRDNERDFVYIPQESLAETGPTPLPLGRNPGIRRTVLPDGGVMYWDQRNTGMSVTQVRDAYDAGQLNSLLGLGPFTKSDAMQSVEAGAQPVAVVERTPDGVPVKAVTGTTELAPEQVAALEAESPTENTVSIENGDAVMAERVAAREAEQTAAPAPEPALAAEVAPETPKLTPKAQAIIERVKKRKLALAGTRPGAQARDQARDQTMPVPRQVTPRPAPQPPRQPVSQPAPVSDTRPPNRVAERPVDVRAATDAFNDRVARNAAAVNRPQATRAETAEAANTRAEARKSAEQEIAERTRQGELSDAAAQQEARLAARKTNMTRAKKDEKVQRARIAGELLDQFGEGTVTEVRTIGDKKVLKERLDGIVEEANRREYDWPGRVSDVDADAVVWLQDVRMMARKLAKNTATYSEINGFLADEAALKGGDSSLARERRKAVGQEIMGSKGGDTSNIAAAPETATLEEVESETEGDTTDVIPETSAADDADVAAKVNSISQKKPDQISEGPASEVRTVDEATAAEIAARYGAAPAKPKAAPKAETKAETAKKTSRKRTVSKAETRKSETPAQRLKREADELLKQAGATKEEIADLDAATEERNAEILQKLEDDEAWLNPQDMASPSGWGQVDGLPQLITPERKKADGWSERNAAVERTTLGKLRETLTRDRDLSEADIGLYSRFTARQKRLQNKIADRIFAAVAKVADKTEVYILDDADFDTFRPNSQGYFSPRGDYIVLRASVLANPNRAAHIVMHEAAHAATTYALARNLRLDKQVSDFRRMVEAKMRDPMFWGDKSWLKFSRQYSVKARNNEFIAEIMSNPALQEALATIKLTPSQKETLGVKGPQRPSIKTALDWVKSVISDVLGLRSVVSDLGITSEGNTALETALDLAGVLMEAMPEARATLIAGGDVNPMNPNTDEGATILDIMDMKSSGEMKLDPKSIAGRLQKLGVPVKEAVEAGAAVEQVYNEMPTDAQIQQLADALKASMATIKSAERGRPEMGRKMTKQQKANAISAARARNRVGTFIEEDFTPKPGTKAPTSGWLLRLATNLQLAETSDRFFGRSTNPVRRIANLIERRRLLRDDYVKEMGAAVDKLAQAERSYSKTKTGRAQWDKFSNLILDVTTAEVHPDRPLDQQKHISKKGFTDAWKRAQHPKLAARYNALPADLKKLYQETRDTLTNAQNTMALKLTENILLKVGIDDAAMAKRIHEGNPTPEDTQKLGPDLMAHMQNVGMLSKVNGPYFNLARRGDYVVRGYHQVTSTGNGRLLDQGERNIVEFDTKKEATRYAESQEMRSTIRRVVRDKTTKATTVDDGTGLAPVKVTKGDPNSEEVWQVVVQNRHVEFAESMRDAKKLHQALKGRGLRMNDVEMKEADVVAGNAEMLSEQYALLSATVDNRMKDRNLSDAEKAAVKQALQEMSIRFLGSTRIQSSRLPRNYIIGASNDITQNTYEYVRSTAGYIAKLETAPEIEEQMKALQDRIADMSAMGQGNATYARPIVEEMRARVRDIAPFSDDGALRQWENRILTASYTANLGLSPAYSMINALQNAQLGIPLLAARFNSLKATLQMARAYKDVHAASVIGKGVVDTGKTAAGRKVDSDHFIDDIKANLLKVKDGKRLGEAIDYLVGKGLIDANANLEIEKLVKANSVAGKVIDTPLQYFEAMARALPTAIEAMNRTTAAVAAYRLMYDKTGDHRMSMQFAEDLVHEAHGLYSNSNASPVFNHPVGRLALQFKKYPQLVIYAIGKQWGKLMRPGERYEGLKGLAGIAASHAFFAGISGAVAWEVAKVPWMLFSGAMNAFGDLDEPLPEWEEFEEWVDDWLSTFTGNEQLAEMLTYGAPRGVNIDLNSRVGLQNLVLFGEPDSNSEEDWKTFIFDQVLGAPGSTIQGWAEGTVAMLQGDFAEGLEGFIPLKGVRDVGRALTGSVEGRMDAADVAIRIMGFTSARQARIWDERGQDIRENMRRVDQRRRLERAYMDATSAAERVQAASRIRAYNARLGENQRGISINALRRYRQNDQALYARN